VICCIEVMTFKNCMRMQPGSCQICCHRGQDRHGRDTRLLQNFRKCRTISVLFRDSSSSMNIQMRPTSGITDGKNHQKICLRSDEPDNRTIGQSDNRTIGQSDNRTDPSESKSMISSFLAKSILKIWSIFSLKYSSVNWVWFLNWSDKLDPLWLRVLRHVSITRWQVVPGEMGLWNWTDHQDRIWGTRKLIYFGDQS
jgi:hypothetical protein